MRANAQLAGSLHKRSRVELSRVRSRLGYRHRRCEASAFLRNGGPKAAYACGLRLPPAAATEHRGKDNQGHTLVAYENNYGQTEVIALWNIDAATLTQSSFVFA
jgi:hypothetical protein